jgi:hypothetical protein
MYVMYNILYVINVCINLKQGCVYIKQYTTYLSGELLGLVHLLAQGHVRLAVLGVQARDETDLHVEHACEVIAVRISI